MQNLFFEFIRIIYIIYFHHLKFILNCFILNFCKLQFLLSFFFPLIKIIFYKTVNANKVNFIKNVLLLHILLLMLKLALEIHLENISMIV